MLFRENFSVTKIFLYLQKYKTRNMKTIFGIVILTSLSLFVTAKHNSKDAIKNPVAGELSWPVEKGIVSGKFGIHPHTIVETVMCDNPGIDILTDKNSPVRAACKGIVSSIFNTDDSNTVVIIKHRHYFTVYNGLKNVLIKKDDKIESLENIGFVQNNTEGKPVLNFQVWKAKRKKSSPKKLNPENWLARLD